MLHVCLNMILTKTSAGFLEDNVKNVKEVRINLFTELEMLPYQESLYIRLISENGLVKIQVPRTNSKMSDGQNTKEGLTLAKHDTNPSKDH